MCVSERISPPFISLLLDSLLSKGSKNILKSLYKIIRDIHWKACMKKTRRRKKNKENLKREREKQRILKSINDWMDG